MRTTITLDTDVARKIRERIRQTGESAKKIYNDLLRSALSAGASRPAGKKPFRIVLFKGEKGLLPGFSWEMSNAELLDKLDEDPIRNDSAGH